jgi:hypothetical protein
LTTLRRTDIVDGEGAAEIYEDSMGKEYLVEDITEYVREKLFQQIGGADRKWELWNRKYGCKVSC